MRALVKARSEPGIWYEDIRRPKIGHNDVLIRVRRTAICGTDIHIYQWDDWAQRTIPVPMAVGHEFFGEIVDVGTEAVVIAVVVRVVRAGVTGVPRAVGIRVLLIRIGRPRAVVVETAVVVGVETKPGLLQQVHAGQGIAQLAPLVVVWPCRYEETGHQLRLVDS